MKKRFLAQSADYEGTPVRYAKHYDEYGEFHFIIEMAWDGNGLFYLDWIGEHAEDPDEFFTVPFDNIKWKDVK